MKTTEDQAPARPALHGEEEFRAWVRRTCNADSVKQVAAQAGIPAATLSNLLAGRLSIGDLMAARFGYRRVKTVVFEPLPEAAAENKKKTAV